MLNKHRSTTTVSRDDARRACIVTLTKEFGKQIGIAQRIHYADMMEAHLPKFTVNGETHYEVDAVKRLIGNLVSNLTARS